MQSLAALQTLKPVRTPDYTARHRTLADAQTQQRQGRIQELQIQGAESELEAAEAAKQQGFAIADIMEGPGTYAEKIQKVRVINPVLGDALAKTDADIRKTEDQIENRRLTLEATERKNAADRVKELLEATKKPQPIPGRDIPFSEDVEQQKARISEAARPAPAQIPGRDIPLPKEVEQQRVRITQSSRPPQTHADEPLVPVIGKDGKPVLTRRSQAEGMQPASSREQGRAVISGDANKIADYDTSLDDLKTLRGEVPAGSTGAMAKVGAVVPNIVTEWTGFGSDAKKKQAVIDRVKQVIGKALEGGVLRKEDEVKYEKILPTIGDPAEVVKAKLDGLERAIKERRVTLLDSLEDAGYDVGRYRSRGSSVSPSGGNRPPLSSFER